MSVVIVGCAINGIIVSVVRLGFPRRGSDLID